MSVKYRGSLTMDQEMDFCVGIPNMQYSLNSCVPLSLMLYNKHCDSISIVSFLKQINGKPVENSEQVKEWFDTFYKFVKTKFICEIFRSIEPVIALLTRHKLVEDEKLFECHPDLYMIKTEKELLNYDCCFCRNSAITYLYDYFFDLFEKYYLMAKTLIRREAFDSDNRYALNLNLCIQRLFRQSSLAKDLETLLWKKVECVQNYVIYSGIQSQRIQLDLEACCSHRTV